MLSELANELGKAHSAFPDRGGEGAIKFAVKKELPILGIETDDVGRQHIDRKIRCELRDVFASIALGMGSATAYSPTACRGVSTHSLLAAPAPFCKASFCGARFPTTGFFSASSRACFIRQGWGPIRPSCATAPPRVGGPHAKKTWIGRVDLVEPGHDYLRLSS